MNAIKMIGECAVRQRPDDHRDVRDWMVAWIELFVDTGDTKRPIISLKVDICPVGASAATRDADFDDIAIEAGTISFANTWPGPGSLLRFSSRLYPRES